MCHGLNLFWMVLKLLYFLRSTCFVGSKFAVILAVILAVAVRLAVRFAVCREMLSGFFTEMVNSRLVFGPFPVTWGSKLSNLVKKIK